jgi:hypothetical protein
VIASIITKIAIAIVASPLPAFGFPLIIESLMESSNLTQRNKDSKGV